MAPALFWYVAGLIAAVIAFIFAYAAQLTLFNELTGRGGGGEPKDRTPIGHKRLLWSCIALALGSVIAFGVGCWRAVHALSVP